MKKIVSLLPLMLLASVISFAQQTNIIYNWGNQSFNANAAQASRYCVGRMYYNAVEWGSYSSIKFTVHSTYYTSGATEYLVIVKQGNPVIFCTATLGAHTDKIRMIMGPQTSTGTTYNGSTNYYKDIYLDLDYYQTVTLEAQVVGEFYQENLAAISGSTNYQYCTLFSAPTPQSIASFFSTDIKSIIWGLNGANNARVGIGTDDPQGKLHINSRQDEKQATFTMGDVTQANGSMEIFNGVAGAGTYSPTIMGRSYTPGRMFGVQLMGAAEDIFNSSEGATAAIILEARSKANTVLSNANVFAVNNYDQNYLIVKANGNVGIGTTNPGTSKLAVEGTIAARKVKVTAQTPWPDYVFEEQYKPLSLAELERYIRTNKHLPEIPSAKDVAADGVDLGDMNKKLLQKVEELTLYIIEQNKRIEALEKAAK